MTTRDPAPSNTADAEGAQRELQAALDDYGATSMHMCATGDISPAALQAIASSIRSLGTGEPDRAGRSRVAHDGRP